MTDVSSTPCSAGTPPLTPKPTSLRSPEQVLLGLCIGLNAALTKAQEYHDEALERDDQTTATWWVAYAAGLSSASDILSRIRTGE